MNWKNVLLIGAVTLLPASMMAQANILNAKKPQEIGMKTDAQKELDNDAPLKYGYVDDRDIVNQFENRKFVFPSQHPNFIMFWLYLIM